MANEKDVQNTEALLALLREQGKTEEEIRELLKGRSASYEDQIAQLREQLQYATDMKEQQELSLQLAEREAALKVKNGEMSRAEYERLKESLALQSQVADEWDTKWGGKYIRLDGERSPNVLLGETKYPWLPTAAKLEEDRILLGPESRGYMRMVRAIFFDSDETTGIYAESELTNCGAMGKVEWEGKPTMVAGIDPAFTNGGDRTILSIAEVGYARNGQYVCQFTDAIHLNDDATNKAVPRTYQIVQQIVDHCKRKGVSPENVAVDSTGAGAPFCDVLAGEWSPNFMRVTFGGKASDKRVSMNSQLTGEELYMNRVSELWFVGKELMRTRQIYGISSDLAQEMCARNYDMIKTGSLKVKIESKPDFKSRFGRSPDLADAAFLALDCARQRLGLVAVDPPKDDQGTGFRKRVTIESLGKALQNTDTSLLS